MSICAHNFHVYCTMWLRLGVRDLHIVLLGIGESRKNQQRKVVLDLGAHINLHL
jgi:hypothetical protein